MKRLVELVATLALVAGLPVGTSAATLPTWPQAHSDIRPDPSVTFGVLPNGLRYAIQHNATPPGVVSLRLAILAGSMQEARDQEGLAHLLEHMAFRGSAHVPDGEAMRTLERLGSRPGADANAGTGPTSTVYMFDLAHNDDASVDTGLMLLREVGSELTLDPKSLDAERPVVLAEERLRAGPNLKVSEAIARAEFGDHPFGRAPIGRREVIETAPVSRLRAFYDAYYRPERAVLVVAGDIDPVAIEAKIKAKFFDWQGRGAPGEDPPPLNGDPGGAPVQVVAVPGVGRTSLLMLWPRAYEGQTPGKARFIDELADWIGRVAFQRRLDKMETEPNAPFGVAGGARYHIRGVANGTSFKADTISDPARAIDQTLRAVRQVAAYGLSQAEVDQYLESQRNQLVNQATSADTRQTRAIAGQLVGSAAQDQVDISPAQALALFDEVRPAITVARINARLRGTFDGAPKHLLYIAATAPDGGEPLLAKALAQASQAPVSAYAFVPAKPWSHTDFGPPGRVVERRTIDDLGVTFVRFANGLRLTVKPTDFAKDRVAVQLRFGHGILDLPKDRETAADW
ncbi:MAG TPA: pitrilysin family protein, partial [Phenylobacterium sp.]|nr:pitrilysin family protein [Phenylobacterium sp.]